MRSILLALLSSLASALMFNVTIDDTLGDKRTGQKPRYSDGWLPRSVGGAACPLCKAQPDPTLVFDGTWYAVQGFLELVSLQETRHDKSTDVTYGPATVSLDFNGTKIYAFCILFNNIGTKSNRTRLSFYLDGALDSSKDFLHTADPTQDHYLYNQLVYESDNLESGNHSLVISSWADSETGSLTLFDYAIYTSEETPATSDPAPTVQPDSQHTLTSVIGGCLAGAAASVLLLGTALWLYSRRHRKEPRAARSQRSHASGDGSVEEQPGHAQDDARWRSEFGWTQEKLDRVGQGY